MSFQMQQQIKRNAQQIRTYVTDLYDWQQEMTLKQKAKIKILKQQRTKQEQISKQLQKQIQQKKKEQQQKKIQMQPQQKKKDLIRDTTTIKDYYNAWDKYDLDKQINKLQEQQLKPYKPYNPYENSQNYVRAKPKARVNVNINSQRAAVVDPTQLKDKGNLHYKVCEYEKAIDAYSQCIEKLRGIQDTEANRKLKCVVLSNRAMTYMKLNERAKALQDCNESLSYDSFYVKSYLRRADCHKKLGNYRQSLADFKRVQQLDKQDKQVSVQIKKLQNYLQKLFKQARQSLIIQNIPTPFPTNSYRIPIQQVQDLYENQQKEEKSQQKVNYLEEL